MYKVTGTFTVTARSKLHDTTIVWDKITGEANADVQAIEAAKGTFIIDMRSFDAGDWVKNRRLRTDYEIDRHPTATFDLDRVANVKRFSAGFEATASGRLRWRGIEIPLEVPGKGTIDPQRFSATAVFSLDVTRLGLTPPKLFMFKVEDVVTVKLTISGVAS